MERCRFDDTPRCDCEDRIGKYLSGEDRRACDEMIENLKPLIQAIVRRILRSASAEDYDEAGQDVLLTVFGRLGSWKKGCPFCNWVAIVATRKAIDLKRAKTRKPTVPLPPGEIEDPSPRNSEHELGNCVQKVLARVPPEWRRVFELTFEKKKSRKEVAKIVGKSLRTVQNRLAEVLEQIRSCAKDL
jgi:RNA polymerase sigma factor (sigma-70 family)